MQDHPPLLVVADLDTVVVVATGQDAAPPMLITLLTNLPPVEGAGQSLLLAKATIAAILVIRIPL